MAMDNPYDDTLGWYEFLYPAVAASPAYAAYCEAVFGKDLSQQGFMTMEDLALLLDALRLQAGERVLDAGCGVGRITEYIADTTHARMTGLDFSPTAIAMATARTAGHESAPTFVVGDMMDVVYAPASFDAILALDTLYFTDDLEGLMARFWRWLKPGGRLAMFYGGVRFSEEDPLYLLQADRTHLATALRQLGIPYETQDLTEKSYRHHVAKRRAADAFEDRFCAEGNEALHAYIHRESIDVRTTLAAFRQTNSRYLYLCTKA